jgi:hypothetical protein
MAEPFFLSLAAQSSMRLFVSSSVKLSSWASLLLDICKAGFAVCPIEVSPESMADTDTWIVQYHARAQLFLKTGKSRRIRSENVTKI